MIKTMTTPRTWSDHTAFEAWLARAQDHASEREEAAEVPTDVALRVLAAGFLFTEGLIAGPALSPEATAFARGALKAARAIGAIDLGQSIVCSGDRPVAK